MSPGERQGGNPGRDRNTSSRACTICHWQHNGWLVEVGGRLRVRGCDLVISPVLESDQGEYQCQVGGTTHLLSPPATLTVSTEPRQHQFISVTENMTVTAGGEAVIFCHKNIKVCKIVTFEELIRQNDDNEDDVSIVGGLGTKPSTVGQGSR